LAEIQNEESNPVTGYQAVNQFCEKLLTVPLPIMFSHDGPCVIYIIGIAICRWSGQPIMVVSFGRDAD